MERGSERKTAIMIVEDDATLAGEIKHFLDRWGYYAHVATDFENIIREVEQRNPALLLMDVNLPYYDGFFWCRKLREVSQIPILFISSRSEDGDKLQAYAQGGDDYVEKPFRLEILQAKIEAILRRVRPDRHGTRIRLNDRLCFEPETRELFWDDKPVELTKSERKILGRLIECRGQIVTREELMMVLWSTDEFIADGTLTTLVSRLRSKLVAVCGEDIIVTKKGQGYSIAGEKKEQ